MESAPSRLDYWTNSRLRYGGAVVALLMVLLLLRLLSRSMSPLISNAPPLVNLMGKAVAGGIAMLTVVALLALADRRLVVVGVPRRWGLLMLVVFLIGPAMFIATWPLSYVGSMIALIPILIGLCKTNAPEPIVTETVQ